MNDFLNENNQTENEQNLNSEETVAEVEAEVEEPETYEHENTVEEPIEEPAEMPYKEDFGFSENPINYSPVEPMHDYKPMSRGLKVFALIMVAVILLTGSCTAGYFMGKGSVQSSAKTEIPKTDLAARPKDSDEKTPAEIYDSVNKSIVGILTYNDTGDAGNASGIVYIVIIHKNSF